MIYRYGQNIETDKNGLFVPLIDADLTQPDLRSSPNLLSYVYAFADLSPRLVSSLVCALRRERHTDTEVS